MGAPAIDPLLSSYHDRKNAVREVIMLDQPARRPRGRPQKERSASSDQKQRMTFMGARAARLDSDRFFKLCDISLRWLDDHHGAIAVPRHCK
jgi:hypothetical protein